MIKLIALDIDGTLVGHALTISPRVKAAVARAQAQGVHVTLATGRGANPTMTFAAPLQLSAPLICLQGAQIYDPIARRSLHEDRLAPEIVPWIAEHAARRGWHLHFETPRMVYMQDGIKPPEVLQALFRVTAMTPVESFVTDMPEVPSKFLISVHDPAERDSVMSELRALHAASALPLMLMNSHPVLIEGVPPGVNKAAGLSWLTNYLGLTAAEVLAIGDNDNDIPMLEWAGTSVAMGQGSPGALAVADWVAPSVDEDGAAVAIEKFALST